MFITSKLLFLNFILLFSINTFAIDIKVFFVKGNVSSTDLEGVDKKLKKGDLLLEGDTIISKDNSFAILKIEGHSTHKIESNTEVLIADLPYRFEKSEDLEQGANLLLRAGTIFSDVVKTKGVKALTIRTKSSVMGVRGTKLVVSLNEDSHDLLLGVESGVVEVENIISGQRDILIKKQGILIDGDKNFSAPKRYDWLKKLSWDMTSKSKRNQLRSERKSIFKEIRKKKAKWTRNQVVFKQKELEWASKEKAYIKRVDKLNSSPIKSQREIRINDLIKKAPKDLASGITNKKKLLRNDFIKLRKNKIEFRRRDLQKIKQRRRKYRPQPKAPTNTPTTVTPPVDGPPTIGGGL